MEDARIGPSEVRSSGLSPEEEAMCLAFRRHTLLTLDDCLCALQASIPHLSRSALHRLFRRDEVSRLPEIEGDKPKRTKFRRYPIGYLHIDIAEVRTEEGKLWMFVAIDRTSKFAFAKLVPKAGKMAAAAFLREVVEALPSTVHTVLTDNGIQFTNRKKDMYAMSHAFGIACAEYGIEHRLTKVNHPWTNGPPLGDCKQSPAGQRVERMNRTTKDTTVKRYHYGSHDQLRIHLADFVAAYNFARRLKTLRGLTPYEYVVKCWTDVPNQVKINPHHHVPGPNI